MAKRARNLFGFGKKITYHARIVRPAATSAEAKMSKVRKVVRFMGARIIPAGHDEWTVDFDRDSRFEDLVTAKAFVKSWKQGRANPSAAYEAGRRELRAAAAKHGTVNLTPSIAQREEWGHSWGEFMRGWNAEKKSKPRENCGCEMKHNPASKALHEAAERADDRFQAALEKEYGSRAGDMRYRTAKQTPHIRSLGKAYQEAIEKWRQNPSANTLGRQIDRLLDQIYGSQDELQREMLKDKHSTKYKRMAKAYMARLRRLEALQKQYRQTMGIENPPKFDRCVADVEKSLKKAGRPGNAYAICTAAGTRNPEKTFTRRDAAARFRDSLKAKGYFASVMEEPVDPHASSKRKRKQVRFIVRYDTAASIAGNASYRKVKKEARKAQRSGQLEPGPMFKKWRKAAGASKTGKRSTSNPRIVWSAKHGSARAEILKPVLGKYTVEIKRGSGVIERHTKIPRFESAVGIARLRLAARAANPDLGTQLVPGADYADTVAKAAHRVYKGVRRELPGVLKHLKKIAGRKNPIPEAEKIYEEFHGFPSQEVLEYIEQVHYHSVTAVLGTLVCLRVTLVNGEQKDLIAPGFWPHYDAKDKLYWEFDPRTPMAKVIQATTAENGRQIIFRGGDQSIDLDSLKLKKEDWHDHMKIGVIECITYRTRKSFEADGKQEVDFYHFFGKEHSQGVKPDLAYYPISKHMAVIGGRYFIAPPKESLGGVSPGIVG